ncbi:hypothetical protein AKJ65_07335 [candidate division MSBL1 archaeon SCGC-AAA259E19]|uniref:Thoeris protein ThsB TIR-like domain-containing protein n=1 Tax=candidate division MSBL1 archaeon SCGC-AAA259E19 TaxID=1698264 RepID=A0A133UEI8_9EURY|nr:hypothetical protein AKJ65_07335 [candidate division MSBL1 archaeon SCGC-AAA259E19]
MTRQIFLSHSKEDQNLISDIESVFSRTNLNLITEYFEQVPSPPSEKIKRDIKNSEAVFVLLGPSTVEPGIHTSNWISWEIGFGTARGKPVWVFEEVNNFVDFPVPDLTDYMIYDRNKLGDIQKIRKQVESEFDASPQWAPGMILGAIIGGALGESMEEGGWAPGALIGGLLGATGADGEPEKNAIQITCPYEDCKQSFKLRGTPVDQFPCPTCRKQNILQNK